MIETPTTATMTVAELAELLGVSPASAYRHVAAGKYPAIRHGRRIRIPTAPVLRMLGIIE